MAFEILKRNSLEIGLKVPGGRVAGGKLLSAEVRDAHSDRLLHKENYGGHPNMMFERVIHGFCTWPITGSSAHAYCTYTIEDEFDWSCIGSGNAANHPTNTVDLQTPIMATGSSANTRAWTRTRYMNNSETYNCKKIVINSPVSGSDPDGDYGMRIRVSHAHPEITGSSPVNVQEVGFTGCTGPNNTARDTVARGGFGQFLNSRVVLPAPITLNPGQYLVTTYEYELKLPSMAERTFTDIGISGLGISDTSGKVRFASPFLQTNGNAPATIIGSTRDQNIFYVQRSMLISAVASAVSGDAGAAGGTRAAAAASRAGVGQNTALLGLGQPVPNMGSAPNIGWPSTANNSSANRDVIASWVALHNASAQPTYQNDGERTIRFWRNRNTSGTDWLNNRSIFVWGYQFCLNNPFDIMFTQDVYLEATIKWDLMRPI